MSARINAELKIELMSDLCSGSGYSYAGIIDSDICYDTCGIPYIPAKRIKGCLRETLETVLYVKYPGRADEVFGRGGSDQISDLVVSDAVIEGYDALKAQIAGRRMNPDENIKELYGTQNILSRFTHVLAQTKIGKDGAAQDNSLRYTRVVNQYSPLKAEKENLVFYAEVSYSDRNGFKEIIQDTVRATRHMGLKRNRGLGNVRCVLEEISKPDGSEEKGLPLVGASEKRVCISYTIRNTAPLMLSGMQEDTSRTYITGQSILGALAGKYLQMQGTDAEDQTFQDLFLKGEVQFANAYPFDDGITYYPAPLYINKLKKTKKYVNVIERGLPDASKISDPAYDPAEGNQPKKLKGKYISWDAQHIAEYEIAQDIVYHHRHDRESKEGEDRKIQEGILYSMEVIRPDQCFRGMVCLPEKYVPLMKALLRSGDFYFGKSRSAQYGRCVIENVEKEAIVSAKVSEAKGRLPKEFKEGDRLVVTFLSDALFLSERGEYTVYKEETEKAVQKELGIAVQEKSEGEKEEAEEPYLSSLQTTLATGYLGTWNLRKDAKPAIAAGSYLVYELAEPFSVSKVPCFIGERTLEGYGQIRLDRAEDMDYLMWKEEPAQSGTGDQKNDDICDTNADGRKDTQAKDKATSALANLMSDVIIDTWIEQMEYDYLKKNAGRVQISNTALGRVTLMLKESLEENKGKPPEKAFGDFAKRIGSIKSKDTGKKAKEILKAAGTNTNGNWKLTFAEKILSPERNRPAAGEPEKLGITEKELKERINQRWGAYLMYVLTEQKYEGGGK